MIKKIGCAIVGGFALYGLAKLVQETQERLSLTPEAYRLIYETDDGACAGEGLEDGPTSVEADSITMQSDGDDQAEICAHGAERQGGQGICAPIAMPCM